MTWTNSKLENCFLVYYMKDVLLSIVALFFFWVVLYWWNCFVHNRFVYAFWWNYLSKILVDELGWWKCIKNQVRFTGQASNPGIKFNHCLIIEISLWKEGRSRLIIKQHGNKFNLLCSKHVIYTTKSICKINYNFCFV